MLETLSKLLDERVEVFFEGYVRAKRKSQTRLQLEAELATLLPDLKEDQLRVVLEQSDLSLSLSGSDRVLTHISSDAADGGSRPQ